MQIPESNYRPLERCTYQNANSPALCQYVSYKSSKEKLLKYRENSSWLIISQFSWPISLTKGGVTSCNFSCGTSRNGFVKPDARSLLLHEPGCYTVIKLSSSYHHQHSSCSLQRKVVTHAHRGLKPKHCETCFKGGVTWCNAQKWCCNRCEK